MTQFVRGPEEQRYISKKPSDIVAELVKLYKLYNRDDKFYRRLTTFYNYHNYKGYSFFFKELSEKKHLMVTKLFEYFLENKIIIAEYQSSLLTNEYEKYNSVNTTVLPLEQLNKLGSGDNNTLDSLGLFDRILVGLQKEKYVENIIKSLSSVSQERNRYDPITSEFLKDFLKAQIYIINTYDEILVSINRSSLGRYNIKLERLYAISAHEKVNPLKISVIKSKLK